MFGQTPVDRHTATANILLVLGGICPDDMQELSLLPCWSDYATETPPHTDSWAARMVEGGGPGADLLLKRMLAMSSSRFFFSQTALPNQTLSANSHLLNLFLRCFVILGILRLLIEC